MVPNSAWGYCVLPLNSSSSSTTEHKKGKFSFLQIHRKSVSFFHLVKLVRTCLFNILCDRLGITARQTTAACETSELSQEKAEQ